MNETSFTDSSMFLKKSTTTMIESWFIPFDILMIIATVIVIIFSLFFLFIIIIDKTCHTVAMMLIVNSCLITFMLGCSLLSMAIFTLKNDLKKIEYQDSLCIFRGYFGYTLCSALDYSFLIQAIYRYINVIYPNRLFWQSMKFQGLFICLTWIFCFLCSSEFLISNSIVYNVNNQICQLHLQLSFSVVYGSQIGYTIPIMMIIFIYLKLVRYVHEMSKRVTPANTLFHAQRELKMVRRIIILIIILLILGLPYTLFMCISFFTNPTKYHFRMAFLFFDVSLVFMMIALFQFTDPLKTSALKRISCRSNVIVATITCIGGPPAGQGGAVGPPKIFGITNNLTKIDT